MLPMTKPLLLISNIHQGFENMGTKEFHNWFFDNALMLFLLQARIEWQKLEILMLPKRYQQNLIKKG